MKKKRERGGAKKKEKPEKERRECRVERRWGEEERMRVSVPQGLPLTMAITTPRQFLIWKFLLWSWQNLLGDFSEAVLEAPKWPMWVLTVPSFWNLKANSKAGLVYFQRVLPRYTLAVRTASPH